MTVKAIELFRRRPDMSWEDFYTYWLNQHSGMVLGLTGVVHYIQNHPLPGVYGRPDTPCDGVVEVWFENTATIDENRARPYWQKLEEDERQFINRDTLQLLLSDAPPARPAAAGTGGFKVLEIIQKKTGLDGLAFQESWHQAASALAQRPGVAATSTSLARPGAYKAGRTLAYDGMISSWCNSWEDLQALLAAPFPTRTAALLQNQPIPLPVREYVIRAGA